MNPALTKTISLLLIIGIGMLFRNKIRNKDQREGIKTIILSLALPATIFIALLQIDFSMDMVLVPVLVFFFNVTLFILVDRLPLQVLFNIPDDRYRTLVMLIPSLAPGLSCLPFIMEYSGQEPLAMAALGDVGNKIFVLAILYVIAMKWFYRNNQQVVPTGKSRLKNLLFTMINEPVNLVIVVAIVMLGFGLNYGSFPEAISLSIDRISLMMTPLVLLFIGFSVRLTLEQVKTIFSFLCFRSGIAFFLSALLLAVLPVTNPAMMLLIIVFPQSACSFWPYAHMSAVGQLEKQLATGTRGRTFDLDFAMNVLACSLPFSVLIILTIFSVGQPVANVSAVLIAGAAFLAMGVLVVLLTSKIATAFKSGTVEMKIVEAREGGDPR